MRVARQDILKAVFLTEEYKVLSNDQKHLISAPLGGATREGVPEPKRCYNFDGVDDVIEILTTDIGTLDISAVLMDETLDTDISISYDTDRYKITKSVAEKVFNIKVWTDNTATDDQKKAYFHDTIPSNLHSWMKGDESGGAVSYSSVNGHQWDIVNATHSSFHYEGDDVPFSWQNEVGYNSSGSTYIPRDEGNSTKDVIGGELQVKGRLRAKAPIRGVSVGMFDGLSKLGFNSQGNTVTIVSSVGTAVPTIVGSTIEWTSGYCEYLELSDGTNTIFYKFCVGKGNVVYDLSGYGMHLTWIDHSNPNQWGSRDDVVNTLLVDGYSMITERASTGSSPKINSGLTQALFDLASDWEIELLVIPQKKGINGTSSHLFGNKDLFSNGSGITFANVSQTNEVSSIQLKMSTGTISTPVFTINVLNNEVMRVKFTHDSALGTIDSMAYKHSGVIYHQNLNQDISGFDFSGVNMLIDSMTLWRDYSSYKGGIPILEILIWQGGSTKLHYKQGVELYRGWSLTNISSIVDFVYPIKTFKSKAYAGIEKEKIIPRDIDVKIDMSLIDDSLSSDYQLGDTLPNKMLVDSVGKKFMIGKEDINAHEALKRYTNTP